MTTVTGQVIETREVISHEARLRAAELAGRLKGYLRPECAPAPEEVPPHRPVRVHICMSGCELHRQGEPAPPGVKVVGAGKPSSGQLPPPAEPP